MEGGDSNGERELMLRLCIFSYLRKTGRRDIAKAFWEEAFASSHSSSPPTSYVPGEFLHEARSKLFKKSQAELPKTPDNEGSSSVQEMINVTQPANPSQWSKQEMIEKLAAELIADDSPDAFLLELWSKFLEMCRAELQKTPDNKGSSYLVQERTNVTQPDYPSPWGKQATIGNMTAELNGGGDFAASVRGGFLREMWLKFFQKFGAEHPTNPDEGSSSSVQEMIKVSQPGKPSEWSKQVMNEKLSTELTLGLPGQPDQDTQSK